MKEEGHESDSSDSTVLLTNYNDRPEKNEAKRRRLSNLYDRLHTDQHEEENTAPDDANVNRRTNAMGKKRGRSWRVSRYLASIIDTNLQDNDQHNQSGNMEDEIICLDSDDDSDVNGKNQQNVSNVADFNKPEKNNPLEQELVNAKLKVLIPAAINARRAITDFFRDDTISDSFSQKVDKNKQSVIRVLEPSAINARRSTTSFEENYRIFDLINERTSIPMSSKVECEKIERAYQRNPQAAHKLSELQSAGGDADNINVDKNNPSLRITSEEEPVASENLIKTDHVSEACTQNRTEQDNDALLDAKGNKRLLNDDETATAPKRNRTDMELNEITSDEGIENVARDRNLEVTKLEINSKSSQAKCDIHTSNEDNNKTGNKARDTKNMDQVKNDIKAGALMHSAHVFRESKIDELRNEREKPEVPIQQDTSTCLEHVTREESLNMQEIDRIQSEETLDNQHTGKVITEQGYSNPFDNNETRTIQNESQTDKAQDKQKIGEVENEQHANKILKEKEVSRILVGETVNESCSNSSQDIMKGIVEEKACGPLDKHEPGKVQELQSSGSEVDITVIVDAPVEDPKASVDTGVKKPKAKRTFPKVSEMVHTAIKELKEKRGCSLQAIKKFIAAEYKIDTEKLAPYIRHYLIKAVESGAVIQKRKEAFGSVELVKFSAANNSKIEEVKIIDKIQEKQNTDERQQSKPKSNEEIEKQTRSDALGMYMANVETEKALSELDNAQQATSHTSEEQIIKVLDNYETLKERDDSANKVQGKEQDKREIGNVQDKSKAYEPCDMEATDTIQNEKETGKAQVEWETGKIEYQQNIGRTQGIITVQDGCNTTESPEKHKYSDEGDNDMGREAHEGQKTNKEPEQATNMLNEQEARKTQDDQVIGQDSQKEKITNESQDKEQKKMLCVERKTTESHTGHDRNKRLTVKVSLLQFQIEFFTIIKQNIKTGVYPEFATSFDNILQILKANHKMGTAESELVYCCPKCKHVSTFSSSLPKTDIEEPIEKDTTQKCDICSGITKLYFTYMRRYISKNVGTNYKERIANGSTSTKDRIIRPVEQSETDKRKSNELNEKATDSKRMKVSAEHTNEENDKDLRTNTSKDDISVANANLADEEPNGVALDVQNSTESYTSNQNKHPYSSSFQEIEESRHEGTEANDKANNVINKSVLREETTDAELTFNVTEMSNSNAGINENCNAIAESSICENAPKESSMEPTSESQINTSNLNDNVTELNKDVSDENAFDNNDRENGNEENVSDIENNVVSNEINDGRDSELSDDTNLVDSEDNNSPLPVSVSESKKSIDKLPEGSIDNRADIEYICYVCSCVYVYPRRFLSHLRQHKIKNPKIPENCIRRKCKHCNLIFNCKTSFNKHVRGQHLNIYTETIADNLSGHNEERVGTGPIKKKVSLDVSNTQNNKTSGLHIYRCTKCDKTLKTDYAARNHRKQEHPEFRYQKIYRRFVVEAQNQEQDEINDSENEELDESEDSQDPTYKGMTSGGEERSESACSIKNMDEFEASCDSDDSSLCEDDAQGESSDDTTTERETRDKMKMISNKSEKNISEHESEAEDRRNDDSVINHSKLKRIYECLLCKITFSSDWSARKHRMENHPEMKGAPLFKKIQINSSIRNLRRANSRHLSESESSSTGESEEVNQYSLRNHQSNNRNINRKNDEDYSSDAGVNHAENYTDFEKCSREIYSEGKEVASDDETVNASEFTIRKKNERITKLFDDDDERESNIITERTETDHENQTLNNNTDMEEAGSDNETVNASELTIRKKNERITKLFDDDDERQSDVITERTETDHESQTLNKNVDMEEAGSDDETIKASEQAVQKKKERLSKLFGDENSVSNKISQIYCNAPASSKQELSKGRRDSSKQYGGNEDSHEKKDVNTCGEKEMASEDENIKPSAHTVEKRKKRIESFLFDESEVLQRDAGTDCNQQDKEGNVNDVNDNLATNSDNNQEVVMTNKDQTNNHDKRDTTIRRISDKENISEKESESVNRCINNNRFINNDRLRRHVYECLLCKITFPSNWLAHKHRIDDHENLGGARLFKKIQLDSSTAVNDAKKCTDIEKCHKESSSTNNEEKKVASVDETGTNKTSEDTVKINVNESKAETRDNDRLEIDMIDNLLEEYDSHAKEDQGIASNEKEKNDRVNPTPQDKMQSNDDSENKHVQDKTCLDKILITNVTSVADEIYLFFCQECKYATDIYDDTIRHCQNHFNQIHDPVTYCNICQINYDSSCFARHEVSHDKYLAVSIKIKFSYQWLFSNWHFVFEKNNIPLRIAEDVQVKSIYKTFSVKMTVRENGAWHCALYLCGKCSTCVPPTEIEKHVRQKCPSMNYLCSICDRSFLTYEMREHHKIYHKDDSSKLFKIIMFNDKNDEAFNLKLLRAKTGRTDDEGANIFKCLCGLCFGSLKKFKLHFVECESEANDGLECPECSMSRQFSPEELDSHLLLHASGKCDFNVHKITFQLETNNDCPDETVVSQDAIVNTRGENLTAMAAEADLQIKMDLLKDEALSQDTNSEQGTEKISVTVERVLHEIRDQNESLSQETIGDEQPDIPTASEDIDISQVKRQLLKHELLSQESTQSVQSEMREAIIDPDLQVKKDLLKDERLSQDSMSVEHSDVTITDTDIDKDLQDRRGIFNEHSQIVEVDEQLITIDSDSDSDIEFVEN